MRKNAFTLIELLAVIVLLAIIALIAVPIVINIIDDSKKSSEEQSLELYKDTVQKAIAKYQMNHPGFNPSECSITGTGDIECDTITIPIEMNGKKPTDGDVIIKNNKVMIWNIKLENKIYYPKYAKLITDADNNNEVSIGDKYTYKVNNTDTFNFYVLSIEGDNVSLIMDRNICNDGSITYTSSNNYCRYKWYAAENNNTYGPVTAIQELYAGTKNWDNVPDMIMNYEDENNKDSTEYGYTSIITSNGETTITGKPTSNIIRVGTSSKPLKARLPIMSEVTSAECTWINGSCPVWLIENMTYYSEANDKYSMNNNSEAYQNIQGYWLQPSYPINNITLALTISYYGRMGNSETTNGRRGLRPVITVPMSDLSN